MMADFFDFVAEYYEKGLDETKQVIRVADELFLVCVGAKRMFVTSSEWKKMYEAYLRKNGDEQDGLEKVEGV